MFKILRLIKAEEGFSFIEVLIAILLISLIGLGLFAALAFSSQHTLHSDIRATAESIARSEMEYIKNLPYDGTHNPPLYTAESMVALGMNSGWTITTSFSRLDPKGDGTGNDDGIQKISVTVFNAGKSILTLGGYKLD